MLFVKDRKNQTRLELLKIAVRFCRNIADLQVSRPVSFILFDCR
jgi:hypothetical protein